MRTILGAPMWTRRRNFQYGGLAALSGSQMFSVFSNLCDVQCGWCWAFHHFQIAQNILVGEVLKSTCL